MLSSYDEPSYVNNIEHSVCVVPTETICRTENIVENGGECDVVLFPSSETEMLPIVDSDNVNTIDDVDRISCSTESVSVNDSSTVDGVEQVHGSSSDACNDSNGTCPDSNTVNSIDHSDAVVDENVTVANGEQTDESHISADTDANEVGVTEFLITSAPSAEECPDIHAAGVTSTEDESADSCNGVGIARPGSPSTSNAQSLDNNQDETTDVCVADDTNLQSQDVVAVKPAAALSAIPLLSIPQSFYEVDSENATEFSILPSPRSKSDGGGGMHSPSVSALSNAKLEVFTLQSAVAAGGLSVTTEVAVEEAEHCCEKDADADPLKDEPAVAATINVEDVPDSPNLSVSKTQLSLKSESSDNATTGSESLTDVVRPFKKTESMLPLGEAIVQSVLFDDDDEGGITKVDGIHSPRRPLSGISLSAGVSNAGGVKIVPSQSLDTVSCSSVDANLENVDLDGGGFVEISLHSSGGSDRFENLAGSLQNSETTPTRSAGLSAFLSRLSRKPDAATASESPPGWKLFGRVPPKDAPNKTTDDASQDIKTKQPQNCAPSPSHTVNKQNSVSNSSSKPVEPALDPTSVQAEAPGSQRSEKETPKSGWFRLTSSRRNNREVPSTTALILEQRPEGLPMKSPEEALRHQMMYDEMVEAARKKEQKDLKLRKKQRERQMKYEEQMSNALRVWNTQILPCWDTAKGSKKAQELWWNGLPPSIRGKVWTLAIGNDLNVTADLYEICLVRAKDKLRILQDADSDSLSSYSESPGNRESSVELIKLDVSRTFPQLCIFQHGGPYHQTLQGLLGAYACYRPDVGYVQGMSFLAAVLLLNMDAVDTFICFANLLNKPCQVAFFRLDESSMKAYFETYEVFFQENMPQLFAHFKTLELSPDIYIIDWMYTLFAKSLPLDVASRVWDVYCRDGEEFLFRTALGILRMHRDILLRLDFIHLAQFLTRLPDTISALELFDNIAQIHMIIDKQRFAQVLASKRDR